MFFEVIIPFFDRLGTIDTFCDFFIILICYIWMLVEM